MTPTERAAKIANDIAEDIDCGEPRRVLRNAIACLHAQLVQERTTRKAADTAAILRLAAVILDPNQPALDLEG